MKGYAKTKGWLFALRGGPANGVQVRSPWPTKNGKARLPDEIHIRGAVYVPRPMFKGGQPVELTDAQGRARYNEWRPRGMPLDQKIEYVHEEDT